MLLTEYDPKKHSRLLREDGEARLNDLYSYLLEANRIDDMRRAMKDKEYRNQLYSEYDLHNQ